MIRRGFAETRPSGYGTMDLAGLPMIGRPADWPRLSSTDSVLAAALKVQLLPNQTTRSELVLRRALFSAVSAEGVSILADTLPTALSRKVNRVKAMPLTASSGLAAAK